MSASGEVSIRQAEANDWELILAWWGIPEVRAYTTTTQQPTFEQLLMQLHQPGRRDFMIVYAGRRVGRTCLIDHGKYQELSLYIGELDLHGRGIGSEAIRLTTEVARNPVRARVMKRNLRSMRAFLSNGYQVVQEDDDGFWLEFKSGQFQ